MRLGVHSAFFLHVCEHSECGADFFAECTFAEKIVHQSYKVISVLHPVFFIQLCVPSGLSIALGTAW
jgi:hypothetical protein